MAWVLTLVGAGGAVWGLWYLRLTLEPENRTNEWCDLGVAIGALATLLGAMPLAAGGVLFVVRRRRKRR